MSGDRVLVTPAPEAPGGRRLNRTRVQLLGRLVADPELVFTPTGEGVARFVLAVSPNGPAAVDEDATRHCCVAWNLGGRRLADLVVDHLQAGAVAYVEGRLEVGPQPESGQHTRWGGDQRHILGSGRPAV